MRNTLIAVSSALLLAVGALAARADELADSIAALKSAVQKNDGAKAIDLMTKLASSEDPAVTRTLVDLTESERIDVACAAYRLVAPKKDSAFLTKLKSRMGNKKLAEGSPTVYAAVIDAIAVYADRSTLDALEDAMPRYLATNAEFSIRIVHACAEIRDKRVIDMLLKWLRDSVSGTGYTGYASIGKEQRENYLKAHEEIDKQLERLTGRKMPDLKSWSAWWKSAAATFKFPEPEKK